MNDPATRLPVLLRVYDYYPRMDITDPHFFEWCGQKKVTMGYTDYIDFGQPIGVQGCYRAAGEVSPKVIRSQ